MNENVKPEDRLLVRLYTSEGQNSHLIESTAEELKDTIEASYKCRKEKGPCLQIFGAPGIGKTEFVRQIAEEMGVPFRELQWYEVNPMDWGYKPVHMFFYDNGKRQEKEDEEPKGQDEGGILLISLWGFKDRSRDQHNTIYALAKGRLNYGSKWLIIFECNDYDDRFHDICCDMFNIGFEPTVDEWVSWAKETADSGKQHVHNAIIDFIRRTIEGSDVSIKKATKMQRKDRVNYEDSVYGMLYCINKNNNYEAMACPRKWEALSNDLRIICEHFPQFKDINYFDADGILKMCKIDADSVYDEACGEVGKYPANMFVDYIMSKGDASNNTDGAQEI